VIAPAASFGTPVLRAQGGGACRQNEGVSLEESWSDGERSDAPVSRDRASHGFDRDFWDERWSEVLREHPEQIAQRPPNAYLTETVDSIAPGRALDAGCGHGSEALWLAVQGWRVTAVDFSKTALAHGRSRAESLGPKIAERIAWIEGDLAIWTPEPGRYDLVSSLYLHVAGSVEEMVSRLATGVAPGGILLLVGHLPVDPVTGAETSAAGQVQVTVDAAATLDSRRWQMLIAEERPRAAAGTGFDAVICARRLP
jgi:SAM-dependent methyltransferase